MRYKYCCRPILSLVELCFPLLQFNYHTLPCILTQNIVSVENTSYSVVVFKRLFGIFMATKFYLGALFINLVPAQRVDVVETRRDKKIAHSWNLKFQLEM